LTLTPAIIDEKVKAQDILNESVSITNTSEHKMTLYPSIYDVSAASGEQSFKEALSAPDAQQSVSNWTELSRGVVELNPGEEKTIPFVIRVPRDAVVGSYHARVSFYNGTTRDDATKRGSVGDIALNVELTADVKELMQVSAFSTDNVVFSGDDALFKYQLQNIGNQPLDPKGEIRIYDRRGEEVASVNVNNEGKVVSPDKTSQLASVWGAVSGFGRYKAVLDVTYGAQQVASVQDATYFWVIPWKQVLIVFIITLIGLILLSLHFERWFEDRHFAKFAAAGLFKTEVVPASMTPQPVLPVSPRTPASAATSTPVRETAPKMAPESLRSRLQIKPLSASKKSVAANDTIDLKSLMRPAEKRVGETHVINLKG
jgi:hypothetical protein